MVIEELSIDSEKVIERLSVTEIDEPLSEGEIEVTFGVDLNVMSRRDSVDPESTTFHVDALSTDLIIVPLLPTAIKVSSP